MMSVEEVQCTMQCGKQGCDAVTTRACREALVQLDLPSGVAVVDILTSGEETSKTIVVVKWSNWSQAVD